MIQRSQTRMRSRKKSRVSSRKKSRVSSRKKSRVSSRKKSRMRSRKKSRVSSRKKSRMRSRKKSRMRSRKKSRVSRSRGGVLNNLPDDLQERISKQTGRSSRQLRGTNRGLRDMVGQTYGTAAHSGATFSGDLGTAVNWMADGTYEALMRYARNNRPPLKANTTGYVRGSHAEGPWVITWAPRQSIFLHFHGGRLDGPISGTGLENAEYTGNRLTQMEF
jgi:hypothetical protein